MTKTQLVKYYYFRLVNLCQSMDKIYVCDHKHYA